MGARCCCGQRPEVGNRDLHAQLLKDDRTTVASTINSVSPPHGGKVSISPSITDTGYDGGNRGDGPLYAVDDTTAMIEDEDDPFASPRHFVDENELSFKSGTSHDYDHGSMSSVSSLNGTTPGKEGDSYEDSSARFKYSSQKFDESPSGGGHHGWDI
ncbi:hypothetical protein DYB32_010580 [Aphanomyces invadans]|uniref:Uncharacterized protein n=1 Tax=Aphanomyces invadans TaxID=157072 RepID=A0A418AFF5_9STRA|nr:hypothetical protein DYB32_010580 [Aphanomyces invadans]